MDHTVVGSVKPLAKQVLVLTQPADGKIAQNVPQLLRHRLDALTQGFRRRQSLQVKGLFKERFFAVVTNGIKPGFAHGNQPDHRAEGIDIWNPVIASWLGADRRQMGMKFLFSQLLANKCQPGGGCDGCGGKLNVKGHGKNSLSLVFTCWVKLSNTINS